MSPDTHGHTYAMHACMWMSPDTHGHTYAMHAYACGTTPNELGGPTIWPRCLILMYIYIHARTRRSNILMGVHAYVCMHAQHRLTLSESASSLRHGCQNFARYSITRPPSTDSPPRPKAMHAAGFRAMNVSELETQARMASSQDVALVKKLGKRVKALPQGRVSSFSTPQPSVL
jgi:hypothetical protein